MFTHHDPEGKIVPKLIGEVGLSHEGSLGIAMNLVKNAKNCGLDLVKFQMHDIETESTSLESFRVNVFPQDKTRMDYWQRTSFSSDQWLQLVNYCRDIEIEFLCTPFSVNSARFLKQIGCDKIKVGSGDSLNLELLSYCKKEFDKVLVSTGMSYVSELDFLVSYFSDMPEKLVLMQCTSLYPTPPEKVGLVFIEEMKRYGVELGLSDHTGSKFSIFAGITKEISFIEFHLAYSRNQFGPDANSSITFDDALEVVAFREHWKKLSSFSYSKDVVSKELSETRLLFGRSLALKHPLKKGEILLDENLTLKKPGGYLNWSEKTKVLGKRALFDIDSRTPLSESLFEKD